MIRAMKINWPIHTKPKGRNKMEMNHMNNQGGNGFCTP